jgi:predicted nuclease of predicted toxin-antitoxin system
MTLWIDAQLSPFIALWINTNFPDINAKSLRSLGLHKSNDSDIFQKAKTAEVVLVSKDHDFVRLVEQHGTPPQLIWITCGNTSNANLCNILQATLQHAVNMLNAGESIVEISSKSA